MPGTLMVVEDEPSAAEMLVEALQGMGYEVVASVASAAECIAAAERRLPDLVLMDINLGGDLDGIDTTRMLRERFDLPVVFLSGQADERTVERARHAGALGYLLKPFRWVELKSAVEVALFRHGLERQLRRRERWLTTTLRAIGDAAIAIDPDARVVLLNAIAVELLAEREEALQGRSLCSLIRLLNENTREPIADPLLHVFETGLVARCPANTALIAAGRELPVHYTVAPIIDEHGNISGAVAIIKDLTEQRRAQQQIAIADRIASLGVMTAGIAHEINNPLTYVLGNLEFVSEEIERLRRLVNAPTPDNLAQARDALQSLNDLTKDVEQGARHVASIVSDLRFLSRRDSGQKSSDVTARMEWALRVTHSTIARHAHVQRIFQPVPRANLDEGRLGQIFLNLLHNATDAMSQTDTASNELSITIDVDPDPDGPFIRVAIADTGCGIPSDILERIFDPFFTTKPPDAGSGLGLAVCHGILTEVGGDIGVTSEPGKGSRFVVRLPIADADSARQQQRGQLVGIRARVLVVDDDPHVLGVLLRMLGKKHDVVTADSARAALDLMRTQPEFDVIICDLIMPDINGFVFHSEVEARSADLASRIIFLSGGAATEQETDFFSRVPNRLMQKPPVAADLLLAIERQLVASGRGRAAPPA
ncbi:MAG TPA: response regulator [Polyangiaceae bacterium]|nr:response regulator [Polyangiaceae bacterium]